MACVILWGRRDDAAAGKMVDRIADSPGIIYLAGDTLTRRIELDLTNRAAQLVAEEKARWTAPRSSRTGAKS